MPAATAAATHMPGHEAMDLSIVLMCVKKGIVLIPLVIMFLIFFIRKVLVFPNDEAGGEGIKTNMTLIGDQDIYYNTNSILRATDNVSNENHTLTFKDYFLTSNSDGNMTVNT